MTIIVSSHILAELDDYSTHILMIRDGRIVEHGPLSALEGGTAEHATISIELARARIRACRTMLAAVPGIAVSRPMIAAPRSRPMADRSRARRC